MGLRVVVMGVSGSGKTTVGRLLADRLGVEYGDADDFHTPENRAKLQTGTPLTDDDRMPWLTAIGQWLGERASSGAVVSCSALKRRYRDVIRSHAPDIKLLYCEGSIELVTDRVANRSGHFMPPSLLESQFAELEPPADERAFVADIARAPEAIVDDFLATVLSSPRDKSE